MSDNSNIAVVTIDGPSGSGKGTAAQALAMRYDWHYLDSGAVYRVLALAALRADIVEQDDNGLVALSQKLSLDFVSQGAKWRVVLDGDDVTRALRAEEVGSMASKISVHSPVRAALLALQRSFQKTPGLITDGRDMGTVVFPAANLKIYLEASPEIRAKRRFEQLVSLGVEADYDAIHQGLVTRDKRDAERDVSPTKPAHDAVTIDTSTHSADEVIDQISQLLHKKQLV